MNIIETKLPGLLIIDPNVFGDKRGYFFESYNAEVFRQAGLEMEFLQDNESCSGKGILRGLHFQEPPYEQGKLVRVARGGVMDVSVDIRKGSPTFGKWEAFELNEHNKRMLYIPPGFAHGFVTLEENTIFIYKCTNIYHKESENSIRWDDPDLNIDWGISEPVISDKDRTAPLFRELESPF
ncbi:MAG: dTDP-4-dehydrorhamnose 3,5-epimerase [Bacteroidales bacterium]|jgi:dTDP-4-dehydrorhamnose 3,5-epimerase|nr:dTDP-4-dehydrorhamnose 3,5-epimerase [Bacteroidales bacterium]